MVVVLVVNENGVEKQEEDGTAKDRTQQRWPVRHAVAVTQSGAQAVRLQQLSNSDLPFDVNLFSPGRERGALLHVLEKPHMCWYGVLIEIDHCCGLLC